MKKDIFYLTLAAVFAVGTPVLAQMADTSATTTTQKATSGTVPAASDPDISSYDVNDPADMRNITYNNRRAFADQVESHLNDLDNRANSMTQVNRKVYYEKRDNIRHDLKRVNDVNEENWTTYRNGVYDDLNNTEGLFTDVSAPSVSKDANVNTSVKTTTTTTKSSY